MALNYHAEVALLCSGKGALGAFGDLATKEEQSTNIEEQSTNTEEQSTNIEATFLV